MQNVVLIAHADAALTERYLDALDEAGCSCLTSSSGTNALETAMMYGPQVVVLQVHLPDVQGTDVCLRLKQESAAISVVLLGQNNDQERFVSNEVGADAFLDDGADCDELVETVKKLLARH
jgi:DNA-binding response OmpR family regulator